MNRMEQGVDLREGENPGRGERAERFPSQTRTENQTRLLASSQGRCMYVFGYLPELAQLFLDLFSPAEHCNSLSRTRSRGRDT